MMCLLRSLYIQMRHLMCCVMEYTTKLKVEEKEAEKVALPIRNNLKLRRVTYSHTYESRILIEL